MGGRTGRSTSEEHADRGVVHAPIAPLLSQRACDSRRWDTWPNAPSVLEQTACLCSWTELPGGKEGRGPSVCVIIMLYRSTIYS
jgi:hypothetical protein